MKSATVDVGDERLGPAELRVPRRQLLPDVKQAQVGCVAVVGRDGVIVAIRGVLDHRTVGEEHQVIPRQLNALVPGGIVVDQRGSEGLFALVLVSISRTRVSIWKRTPFFSSYVSMGRMTESYSLYWVWMIIVSSIIGLPTYMAKRARYRRHSITECWGANANM